MSLLGLWPDFYLASTEGYDLQFPRRCWRIRPLATEHRDDLLLVRISPDIGYGNNRHERVVLASRHLGVSVLDIDRWPAYVHVAVPRCGTSRTGRSSARRSST